MLPLLTDFYKVGHKDQYPEGTSLVFSNLTARSSRVPGADGVVFFGLQAFLQELNMDAKEFFRNSLYWLDQYSDVVEHAGLPVDTSHWRALADLGYLPIEIRAVPEGTLVPIGAPMLTIHNTNPDFFWLTNYLETLMSAELWQPITSATTARRYRQILESAAKRSGMDPAFVDWQGHDFSFRGMAGSHAAVKSGMAHLFFFRGTDTIPAIQGLRDSYRARGFIGGSVPATEHSVMCAGGEDGEFETFKRLITETYPTGIVSIVSDTWDLWTVLTDYLPRLKDEILARDGKVVIRPDSGDPVKIICGDPDAPYNTAARVGAYRLLFEVFRGERNDKGRYALNPKVGLIYGDSITPERAETITSELEQMGFEPSVVFGIGSYTYQHVTRDTYGMAMKATYVEVNGVGRPIFKNPKTGPEKKSHRGLLALFDADDGGVYTMENATWDMVNSPGNLLRPVYRDGMLLVEEDFETIRARALSTV